MMYGQKNIKLCDAKQVYHYKSSHSSCVPTGHQELSQRVTVPYAACVQLYPPEDEHLRLETCRGGYYFMNK